MTSSRLRVVQNPPNPWQSTNVEWVGEAPELRLEVFEERARSIIAQNQSPDVPFRYSVNPYRGCFHACAYCYARPSHQYLDFGAGTDFERRIVVKTNAPELLESELDRKRWKGDLIAFSGDTDCYQPLEASYRITRACMEICARYRNPVGIITKSTLVERDIDVLREMSHVVVNVSVPFLDDTVARAIEPSVPTPRRRLETIAKLSDAGIRVGVMVAPIIPGLNDSDIPLILKRAREAGARHYGTVLLRLPKEVNTVFEERLRAQLPLRADKVLHQIEACRDGKRNQASFGARMTGSGPRWAAIEELVHKTANTLGFEPAQGPPDPSPFTRPNKSPQLTLF